MRVVQFGFIATLCLVLPGCGGGGGGGVAAQNAVSPAVVVANADQTGQVGYAFTYDVTQGGATFRDPNGDPLTLTISFSNNAGLSAAGSLVSGTFTRSGTITVSVTAADPDGNRVTDSFDVLVSIDQDAIRARFGSVIDLASMHNYANQPVPAYIGEPRDNGNPVTDAGATLGRILFYDTALSIDDTIACASCHQQAFAFSDIRVVSVGVQAGVTRRHAMRLVNTRFGNGVAPAVGPGAVITHFWDERAASAEDQETQPIRDHNEHGFSGIGGRPGFDELIAKLEGIPYYEELFRFAFLNPEITEAKIQLALAQFTKSIQSFDSKYDAGRTQVGSDTDPFPNFTADENAGKALFETAFAGGGINCQACHASPEFAIRPSGMGAGHNGVVGEANDPLGVDFTNTRSPVLRDLVGPGGVLNGPLMHDGSMTSLREVIDHYNHVPVPATEPLRTQFLATIDGNLTPGGLTEPRDFGLTDQEKAQLEAFLRTLTGVAIYSDERWSNPFQ